MKQLMRALRGKRNSRRGESLSETLVALLIAAVGLVMLASMISTSSDLNLNSRETMERFYAEENELASLDTSGSAAAGTVTVTNGSSDTPVVLRPGYPASDNANMYSVSAGGRTFYAYEYAGN